MKKKTVVIGMSGGVDSSVAAKILLEEGYYVIGLFMHNWDDSDENGECSSANDWADVQAVCGKLDIPCYSVNFSKEYMEHVFSYFLDEYKIGRTPNPDVLCNREIKFGPFVSYARRLGAEYIATGHYCGISHASGTVQLLKAADTEKDQTYFLNQVKTEQLMDVKFPLAKLTKDEVRFLANKYKLVTAAKKDSTGICFIGERKFKEFLQTYLPMQKGRIVDLSGKEIGEHDGLMFYTLGQRRGLKIGGVKDEDNNRWYVVDKQVNRNILVVSNGEGKELYSKGLTATNLNFIGDMDFSSTFACTAKCRYRQTEQDCAVSINDGEAIVEFLDPQRAVTPGQYVVFYKEDRCLGGGVIDEIIK
ncbi:trna 5-methylaminomethyl-2-thiouridylate -methyltransferase [Holotrichia oblita]|nr:trna 5-methylaminomethyl-2-thiouridylate -methyltransferase [Holotrichia oblita]